MAAQPPPNQLLYGSVAIYQDKVLGVGSYGKVCKAKYGHLPCAAKLLHDTMFEDGDPGIYKFAERFEQECQFLSMIKHPNIVQYLGSYRDPQSRRLALLMELMDESLTKFLERSPSLLHYHTQLNICHDVALALSYLHSNAIIHRDLSSNNVLLIGEGSRAKVTDFGMSKLIGINPRMTPLTLCPGASVYMPPEALTTPPEYSNKLDCFSHGVLTIQVITKNFPNPGDAHKRIRDPNFPKQYLIRLVPEIERRKKDIDLVRPEHPLLPIALHCLEISDTDRPSADEVCERLAVLKREGRYAQSVEQVRGQVSLLQRLQQELTEANEDLRKCRTDLQDHKNELIQKNKKLHQKKKSLYQKDEELTSQVSLAKRLQQELTEMNEDLKRYQTKLRDHQNELVQKENELASKDARFQSEKEKYLKELTEKDEIIEKLQKDTQKQSVERKETVQKDMECSIVAPTANEVKKELTLSTSIAPATSFELAWKPGTPAPLQDFAATFGTAVGCDKNTAYFSNYGRIFSFSLLDNKWTELPSCGYELFGMAVIERQLTTVGGRTRNREGRTNTLLTFLPSKVWEEVYPAMPTKKSNPAVVTTHTHLVVAGGKTEDLAQTDVVEILDFDTLQWSTAMCIPQIAGYPQMTISHNQIYLLAANDDIFACSMEELLESCKLPACTSCVWNWLADVPLEYESSLAVLNGHVLAIGGCSDTLQNNPSAAIHCYDKPTNSWRVIGQLPAPLSCALTAVLPSNEVIVVGGMKSAREYSSDTYIGLL